MTRQDPERLKLIRVVGSLLKQMEDARPGDPAKAGQWDKAKKAGQDLLAELKGKTDGSKTDQT